MHLLEAGKQLDQRVTARDREADVLER